MLRPISVLAAAAAALLAGCSTSTTQIDSGKAETFVKRAFNTPPRTVKCPSGVEAKAGGTLTCHATDARGRRYDVVLHMVDDKGSVKVDTTDVHAAG